MSINLLTQENRKTPLPAAAGPAWESSCFIQFHSDAEAAANCYQLIQLLLVETKTFFASQKCRSRSGSLVHSEPFHHLHLRLKHKAQVVAWGKFFIWNMTYEKDVCNEKCPARFASRLFYSTFTYWRLNLSLTPGHTFITSRRHNIC